MRFGYLALITMILIGPGCVRMDILPGAREEITRPLAEPRRLTQLEIPLEKDPTVRYRVGPRDVIRIDERRDPDISDLYTVTAEGFVLLPFIGPVRVQDMTTDEIAEMLVEVLREYGIRDPSPQVGVLEYNSKVVYVVGQIANPGPVVMNADMLTVQQAVVAAGFPTPEAALKATRVISPDYRNPIVRQINLGDVLYAGIMEENMLLRPGDYVYIPSKHNVNLAGAIGELLRPVSEVTNLYYRAYFFDRDRRYGQRR